MWISNDDNDDNDDNHGSVYGVVGTCSYQWWEYCLPGLREPYLKANSPTF